jgi:hypothetical protein
MKKFNRISCKAWRAILSFMGLFFGFSSAIVAQYGAIENRWMLVGDIETTPCELPMANLKLSLEVHNHYYGNQTQIGQAVTDEKGHFSFYLYDAYSLDSLTIKVSAKENDSNYKFKDTIYIVPFDSLKFASTNSGHWTIDHVNKKALNLKMNLLGASPCDAPAPAEDCLWILPLSGVQNKVVQHCCLKMTN